MRSMLALYAACRAALASRFASSFASRAFASASLAACASTLLLAVTNHLSQNVAAIPFLWVLPLALYLLTLAPSITEANGTGDSGELASTAYMLGNAHLAVSFKHGRQLGRPSHAHVIGTASALAGHHHASTAAQVGSSAR